MTADDMVIEELVWSEKELRIALETERADHAATKEAYLAALRQMHEMTVAMRNMRERARELRVLLSGESASGKPAVFDTASEGSTPSSPTSEEKL